MRKLKVGILFGGASEEHPVSVKSAGEVAKALDTRKYEPFYVGITKSGAWRLCDSPDVNWERGAGPTAILSPDTGLQGLLVLEPGRCRTIRLDVVLPVLHGRLGEDGAVQGLLELSGIPYVGCDVASSALCMDKALAYLVARSAGVATPSFWTVTADEQVDADRVTYPVFVKPARSGSSFGVSKVEGKEGLLRALEDARQYDSKVLIEEAVAGSEVGCAILGTGTDLIAGEVDQIRVSHGFFRIHQESAPEAGSENSTVTVPADISPEARLRVQETAKVLYRALGCRGLSRVDTFLKEDGTVVLNEVNTLPGLTSYSRYPRMMAAAGLPLAEVIERMVSLALAGKPVTGDGPAGDVPARAVHPREPKVREAGAADAAGVAALLNQLGYRRRVAAVATDLDAQHEATYVAERDGCLLGLATLQITRMLHRDRPVARLTGLVVDARARRGGVGGALLDRVLDEARAGGCEGVELTSGLRGEREDAHRFYEGRGFVRRSYAYWLPFEQREP